MHRSILLLNRHLLMVYYVLCSVWVLIMQKLRRMHGLFLGVHDQIGESDNYNRIQPCDVEMCRMKRGLHQGGHT